MSGIQTKVSQDAAAIEQTGRKSTVQYKKGSKGTKRKNKKGSMIVLLKIMKHNTPY
jgi:hypothetical protein